MMRKSLWAISLLLLSAAVGVPAAHADDIDYTIAFSGASAPTVVGSDIVVYNTVTDEFITPTIDVDWNGQGPIPLSDLSNPTNPMTASYVYLCAVTGTGEFCEIIDNSVGDEIYFGSLTAAEAGGFKSTGFVNLTIATGVPEIDPQNTASALALLIGAVLVIRGRRSKTQSESERA